MAPLQMKREILFFIIAGCSAVLTDLSVYYLSFPYFGHDKGKAISFIAGSIVAYLLNKYFTFQKKENSLKEILKFTCLYLFTLGANVLVNNLTIRVLPDYLLFAFLCATGVSTILNFIGQKYWVFK
ncbi:GtrA family protein [Leptospira ognonensis]|uniref:GtrA family protein n=1 Tax=Leptospira ognonensis TaxID=2484945 RepID=A0A4R9JUJ0_9LEPT|nr:GtrA family protein [Leptospira ognonensis]TGL56479.1 GtrA family protein [Leptospira ognonensis]